MARTDITQHSKSTQFPKGVSGNPQGKKVKSITEFLREYGGATKIDGTVNITDGKGKVYQKVIKLESDKTINELVSIALVEAALNGDLASQKELLDRTEGKAKQEYKIETHESEERIIEW